MSCEGHLSWPSILLHPGELIWGSGLGQDLQVLQVALEGLGQREAALWMAPSFVLGTGL